MAAFCVGVTGGVASGKSEVTRRFQALGVFVADADVAARAAVETGSEGLAQVVAAFGRDILDAQGALDRAAMRRIVFGDEAARRRLEAIVHPLVRAMLRAQCEGAAGSYAIAAIPLLAEGGGREAYPWLDRCLVVDVPVAVQQARVMRRDGIEAELAQRMIAAQATREARLAIADDVVVNDGPIETLQVQVEALDRRYRAMAESLRG
ncbi:MULTISPECIES: dephospho-CoA kinase [unclassified Lysobacter]|uniref:dephospho-CoA kinase n=1 Tax=unclassified Lysobacter TaxID=2635362 RepID=UPI001BE603E3|nr:MULTISPECIES: dephospho-CoA kinase [unclassified Lysobacter]MBT2747913.1 dephospho-CoA kinase [Lysobacter sp. ISL-42]MBT2753747.1 dephospho-CoA kinase [Lysobacter sp. ISL-50]MBT2779244.1 dephospho-CoA kinase [Lysobacter sp. ISL-54]